MSSKPYHSTNLDECDKMYATKLKEKFLNLSNTFQEKFQKFTENLMNENYINRYMLLDAIRDFELKYKINDIFWTSFSDKINDIFWASFSDSAFNFRPYNSLSKM